MEKYFGFAKELLDKGRAEVREIYQEGELYDLLVQSQYDLEFYLDLVKAEGGPILELACGSGRLLVPMQKAGLEVVGLDLSQSMLELARVKLGAEVPLFCQDMRTFELARKFQTILIPYCSLMYLPEEADRIAVFQRCYEHLDKGGLLAFDFLAGEVELGEGLPSLALQGINPFSEEIIIGIIQIKGLRSDLRLLNQINYEVDQENNKTKVQVFSSLESILKPERVKELLEIVGFSLEGVYNGFSTEQYSGGEECLILARK